MTGIFVEAVNRSITAGWLVLAVAVLRLVLKKGPRWVNLLLWGMVALRLLPPDKQYKKLTENDIAVIVSLINQSRGSFVAEHEEMDGGSTFLYLTLADGSAHEVGNMGNTYLVIDGDYFEADYSWLSSWDSIIPEGEGPLPEKNPVRQLTLDEVLELSEKGEALVCTNLYSRLKHLPI